ncbi:hypothetical protein OC845_003491 [Tilletia horrida]|nr:hypothetical protein OC845_003491 [Tilletia horrida]
MVAPTQKALPKGKGKAKASDATSFLSGKPLPLDPTKRRPAKHDERYHVPILLTDQTASESLLSWFESVRTSRDMAWRKDWVDPATMSLADQSRRGYEVLVSETMLQQTRIETVKSYYKNWMDKFASIKDLAEADPDEVMAAWRGLGYYSRATRLQQAAKTVHANFGGVLPSDPVVLERELAGVGRYTAGAVSSIVFGLPNPLLDGNVGRVLSRQIGLHADVKNKAVTDVLWHVADLLVNAVSKARLQEAQAGDSMVKLDDVKARAGPSATPGQWNQALMELGSTICTPFPRCEECPIQKSCRAYAEGAALASHQSQKTDTASKRTAAQEVDEIPDIESLCQICEPMPTLDEAIEDASSGDEDEEQPQTSKLKKAKKATTVSESKMKQSTLSFAPPPKTTAASAPKSKELEEAKATESKVIQAHVRQFPLKVAKKKIREEDAVVCIIEARQKRSSNGSNGNGTLTGKRKTRPAEPLRQQGSFFLIRRRPDKGLLAKMWEMPTYIFDDQDPDRDETDRVKAARKFSIATLKEIGLPDGSKLGKDTQSSLQASYIGSHTHVFSHLKMFMHVVHVTCDLSEVKGQVVAGDVTGKWVRARELEEDHSMGNGMHTCWAMLGEGP